MNLRILTSLFTFLFVLNIYSQSKISEIEKLLSNEDTKEAKLLIDQLIRVDSLNAKLWLYKGLIVQNRIERNTEAHSKKEILDSAYFCYIKSESLNNSNNLESLIAENLRSVSKQYSYTGMEFFNIKEYQVALNIFEKCIKISNLSYVNELDTILWYNAALSAEKLLDYNKAEYYYLLIIKYNKKDTNAILALANLYRQQGFSEKYYSLIKQKNVEFPKTELFYKELVAYYLENKKVDSALFYLDEVLEFSTDDRLFYLKGSVLQDQERIPEAIIEYRKTLELNPSNIDASFNLAVIEYNNAIDLLKKKRRKKAEKKELKQHLNACITYLKIVKEIEPENKYMLSMLLTSYKELGMKSEEKELLNQIKNLKK